MDACDDIDPNSRRTRINIAVSCISTIFLCTWVAFHPNIPAPGESKWKVLRRRIGCMIGGILAPEIYVLLATRQFKAARYIADKYRKEGWTLTHGFLALMGGFMLHYNETTVRIIYFDPDEIDDDAAFVRGFTSLEAFERRLAAWHPYSSNHNSPTQGPNNLVQTLSVLENINSSPATLKVTLQQVQQDLCISIDKCIYEVEQYDTRFFHRRRGGYLSRRFQEGTAGQHVLQGITTFLKTYKRDTTAVAPGKSATTIESPDSTKVSISDHASDPVAETPRSRALARVPRINEQDIQIKSKSDMLTKTIALFQVAWFILQICARYHENLAITELEIFTLAFCVLNFATYALWWKKPFAVDRGYAIRWRDDDWEVIAPPFVKTEEVSWMRSGMKGMKQVLAFRPSYRTVPSGYHQIPEKVFPFYSFFHRDHFFIISTIPALVVSLAEKQASSVKSLGPYRTCGGSSVYPIDSRGDEAP
ncbi:hypothetical protein NLI96_g8854 [Meripilus lineatus]|uniref:Uncharacterized protein n=1 Tax=Meripilus lineatus TaxID=2056292 RepID=A0AAD5UY65_9APHY|nr:hypothetical protein NLI96_g8854 [Physisporinus lineatus]